MKKIKYVIYVLLVVIGVYLMLDFSKSNEQYVADAEDDYKEILKTGIYKKEIKKYLKEKGASYSETTKEKCRPWVSGDYRYDCDYPSSLHTRMTVGSFINPVKSAAHFYLYFDSEEKLVTYKILIKHTFL